MPASLSPAALARTAANIERAEAQAEDAARIAREAGRRRALQERAESPGAYQNVPTEIVQVLNPYVARPAPEENAARSRAGMLAAWLRQGGDRADLPPLPVDAPAPPAPTIEVREAAPEAQTEPVREATEAEKLALRLQIFGGEISEQIYGPIRRWALLDREGALLEAPQTAWVEELIEAGMLLLDRYERGAAVWRLREDATAERRAAYRGA